ncbi:MAG: hypothetical protein LLG00_02050, partial [Planctomycetaceae bacterium]|nr:hypothetical protein [Planctomycetaceae bacterium]
APYRSRHLLPAALIAAALWANGAFAQNYLSIYGQDRTLGLNLYGGMRQDTAAAFRDIAVTQAAMGYWQDAKHTLWQIDRRPPLCPSDVTGVWSYWGRPLYGLRPMPLIMYGAGVPPCAPPLPPATACSYGQPSCAAPAPGRAEAVTPVAVSAGGSVKMPMTPPPGLPAGYFAADPHHGAVVDFTDDRDSRGTRITSRRYADGYVVIETPHAAGVASR